MSAPGEPDQVMRVRQAFSDQAVYCDQLGSPFTALLCRVLSEGLDSSNAIERYILEWKGDASAFGDSVPLRVAGALHYLVRAGRAPELGTLYPPNARPEAAPLLGASRAALQEQESFVREFLQFPPQTNEVGRSAALIAGWLEIAATTQLPLRLFEIGSSAGLNLIADRYAYRFGEMQWTPRSGSVTMPLTPDSGRTIACEWTGPLPAIDAAVRIRSRRGCDRNPLNTVDPTQSERLMAYVWADQTERMDRLKAAIDAMLSQPVTVERAEAGEWLQAVIEDSSERDVARVVFHSIVWSYLEPRSQQLIANHLAKIGAASSIDRPLAWLRLELAGKNEPAELRVTLWPDGEDKLLAHVHPHGRWVRWCGRRGPPWKGSPT